MGYTVSLRRPYNLVQCVDFNPLAAKYEYTRLWQGTTHYQDEYTCPTLNIL